jgi:hypothetical protein
VTISAGQEGSGYSVQIGTDGRQRSLFAGAELKILNIHILRYTFDREFLLYIMREFPSLNTLNFFASETVRQYTTNTSFITVFLQFLKYL